MRNYPFTQNRDDWAKETETILDSQENFSKLLYSTYDYWQACWNFCRHGLLIIDFTGKIIDVNPYFCEKLNYQHNELIGKNIQHLAMRSDDLVGSDAINTITLFQENMQQSMNRCDIKTKDHSLYRCRWVANRIPADLQFPFSHSIVQVYFLQELSFTKLCEHVDKQEKKESNFWYRLLDGVYFKVIFAIILLLTAIGGSLPDLLRKLIELLGGH